MLYSRVIELLLLFNGNKNDKRKYLMISLLSERYSRCSDMTFKTKNKITMIIHYGRRYSMSNCIRHKNHSLERQVSKRKTD